MKERLTVGMLIPVLAVVLSGCGTTKYYPMNKSSVDNYGNIVDTVGGYTSDSSVAKEHEMHETLRNRDNQYTKAYKESGFTMSYQEVEVNGAKAFLPIVSFKETPRYTQQLPTTPSVHPLWGTVNNVVDKGLWGWLGYNFFDFAKTAIKGAGDQRVYNGDLVDSGNTSELSLSGGDGSSLNGTVSPYSVEPEVVYPEVVHPEVFAKPGAMEQVGGGAEEAIESVLPVE